MRLLAILFVLLPTGAFADDYIIHAGHLIDVVDAKVLEHVSVIVHDNRIEKIEQGFTAPRPGQQLADLSDSTVMPGLMDMHVHLTEENPTGSTELKFRLGVADVALRAGAYAERTLLAGFTTVRDLGESEPGTAAALKEAIRAGIVRGPRLYSAGGAIVTTGGFGDPARGVRRGLAPEPGLAENVIDGPDEARKIVRMRFREGAEWIKLRITAGLLSSRSALERVQFDDDELAAVVSTAHRYGLFVTVHAHGAEGVKRAVRAGVDSVEHGTFADSEAIQLLKSHGVFLIPTISVGKYLQQVVANGGHYPGVSPDNARELGSVAQDACARAYKAGVHIVFGTDAGISPHGNNALEFRYMVEAGMPPMAAIQSATIEAARLLRATDDLGALRPGKLADIVAVRGNPLQDISILSRISFVMKDGKVYKDVH